MKDLIQCSLLIYSDTISPKKMTEILEIQPSHTAEKGTPIHCSTHNYVQKNGWFLVLECDFISEIDITLQKLLNICLEKKKELALINDAEVSIRCHVSSEYGQIGYELSQETISAIARLGVGLQITIFSYGGIE